MELDIVDRVLIYCARRNSGKSELLKYIVNQFRHKFDKIYVLSPTERVNDFYKESGLVEDDNIFDNWDENWVKSLIGKMTMINSKKPKDERKHICLICDDIVADKSLHSSSTMRTLIARGRHINISIIFTVQSLTMVSPLCRSNADFVFIGQLNNASLNIACDEYLAGSLDKKQFIEMYRKHTGDFNFLIINQSSIKDTTDMNLVYGTVRVPDGVV